MVSLTYQFKFCAVSRWAALAQVIFCVAYLAIPNDEMYNLAIQVIIGIAALILTLITFVIQQDKQWTSKQSLPQ